MMREVLHCDNPLFFTHHRRHPSYIFRSLTLSFFFTLLTTHVSFTLEIAISDVLGIIPGIKAGPLASGR